MKKWARRSSVAGLLFIAFVSLLPIVMEFAAEKWLKDNGAAYADIGDIDFNIFTAQLSIINLNVSTDKDATFSIADLSLELDWQPLSKRRVVIKKITLSDTHLDIRKVQNNWLIGKLTLPPFAPDETPKTNENEERQPWFFGLDSLALNNILLNYQDEKINTSVLIKQVSVDNVASWDPSRESTINIDLAIEDSHLQINSKVVAFSRQPVFTGTLNIKRLSLANYKHLIELNGIDNPNGYITTDLTIDARLNQRKQIKGLINGQITLDDLRGETDSLSLSQKHITWEGRTEIAIPPLDNEDTVNLTGSLLLSGTDAKLHTKKLHLENQQMSWEGELAYRENLENGTPTPSLSMLADVNIRNIKLSDTNSTITLINSELIEAKALVIENTTSVTLAQLIAANSNILQLNQAPGTANQLAALGTLIINNIDSKDGETLTIQSVRLNDLQVDVTRNTNGNIRYVQALQAEGNNNNTSIPEKMPNTETLQREKTTAAAIIKVDKIQIAGNSWVHIKDNAVSPAYVTKLHDIHLSVSELDSAKSDHASKVTLSTKIGQYASLSINGDVYVFAEKPTLNLKGQLLSLDLPPLSSYTGKYLGYNIKRGTLSSDININIEQGKLNIANKLKLSKLNIAEMDADKVKGLTQQLAMPLDAALDMLRDSDDNIEFEVAIDGDINDPKFDPSGIINLAMGKALKVAAMSYVKTALQPLGTIMLVGNLLGKATALKFEPVKFIPGSPNYAKNNSEYLDKIAKLLKDRPKLKITICGVATLQDETAMINAEKEQKTKERNEKTADETTMPSVSDEQLVQLAKTRGDSIKSYLVEQKGIKPERIFSCHPVFDSEKNAMPRADITL